MSAVTGTRRGERVPGQGPTLRCPAPAARG